MNSLNNVEVIDTYEIKFDYLNPSKNGEKMNHFTKIHVIKGETDGLQVTDVSEEIYVGEDTINGMLDDKKGGEK